MQNKQFEHFTLLDFIHMYHLELITITNRSDIMVNRQSCGNDAYWYIDQSI